MPQQLSTTDHGNADVSAPLQQAIRTFTSFYEQHAYLAYNLALRITCDADAAMRAAGRGFLRQLDDRPMGLVAATVSAALDELAPRSEPSGGGDAEAEAMLRATFELRPPERTALALADLAGAEPDLIAATLGINADNAAKLLYRARERFAACVGLPRSQADAAARDWLWAAPPVEIWHELYPRFHRVAERAIRRGRLPGGLYLTVPGPTASALARKRTIRLRPSVADLPRRWSRRTRWEVVLPLIALFVLGAGATARLAGDRGTMTGPEAEPALDMGSGATARSGASSSTNPADEPHRPLTPEELDKLRLRELAQLRSYTKRTSNQRLSARERGAAARGIRSLQRAAERRLRAQQRREDALREQLARARARNQAPPPPPLPRSRATNPRSKHTEPARAKAPAHNSPQELTREEAQRTCLLNEDTGEYICPE